ncbi:MAG: ATP-binding cassette domain-containing protein [Rhizobiales bacterium]|nr:ATP-binding cassette domain-containing protein [Hyphomicrobiales bacterium]
MLRVDDLTKTYMLGDRSVAGGVRHVSFDVAAGEFYTLLGPSGCGKTTTLRAIAGLEEPSEGRIDIDGRVVFNSATGAFVAANQRNIGMVFQSYAVWPHMTVFDNVAFPLRMSRSRRYGESDIRAKVEHTLETMGLAAFASRSAAQLSGGQQQRLSLARALVAEPRLLLLDEPLSNLDALLREQMRSELRRLQQDIGVTAIYVTHDQAEALALSDRVAVMRDGAIVQVGTPKQVYYTPADEFVATFIGRSNLLHGRIDRDVAPNTQAIVQSAIGPVICTFADSAPAAHPVLAMIRPEHLVLAPADAAPGAARGPNHFSGRIANVAFLGETTEYTVRVAETEIIVRMPAGELVGGADVTVLLPPDRTLGVSNPAAAKI